MTRFTGDAEYDVGQTSRCHDYYSRGLWRKLVKLGRKRDQTISIHRKETATKTGNIILLLICSDFMARGIDVEDVDCVVCYDLPSSIKAYVHRIGRTARAGKPGVSFTLLSPVQVPFTCSLDTF
ncbi:unnamed protein product [Protopolystoma xenopodis]|uniref:ATP-dependent RNA helicase n=1 Tax=Protopolystoma xenopodis TaxID=117903 RepID=A0A448XRH9_9PLAT|nr:unnamed protein product [Protopolystoma xenopodis]